jgi:hypothetical protein
MAGVDYSIFTTASSAGQATINILKAPTDLVGLMFTGQYFGIQLDPVRVAYVPNAPAGGNELPMIPVYYPIVGIQLNVIYQSSGQVVVLFFGEPLEDSIPLEAYAGVVGNVSVTNSGTSPANLTQAVTLNFPQGALRLIGIAYFILDSNSAYDQWSFNTAGGLQVNGLSVISVGAGGRFAILPLNFVFVPQSITINVIANQVKASSTHQAVIIAYYAFE